MYDMSGSSVLEGKAGTSVLNPEYGSFIGGLVDELLKKFPKLLYEHILLLSFYNER